MRGTLKTAIAALSLSLCVGAQVQAQHTIALTGGYGMTSARLYPKQETRGIWGVWSGGVSWRYYALPRFVGGFGIDLEWMQRGYSYAPYASLYEDKKEYKYYTRRLNTLMLPIVWQPHVYMFHNRLRIYLEAAVTFSYNFCSTFDNEEAGTNGRYEFRTERDNRFGYGLAGGGGIDFLTGRIEIGVRVRYDFGYADILRNRNKYYDNVLDEQTRPGENPFWLTPMRSPLDNLSMSLRIGFRFNKEGFREWSVKRKPRRKNEETFKFSLD